MRSLRTTWRLRSLTVLLAVSLLPMTVVVPSSTALPPADDAQADWLRAHIEAPSADDKAAVEAALEAVRAEPTVTLRDFLRAFASAYQQHAPDRSLGQLFGLPELGGDALLNYLQQRVPQVSGWATVLHRLTSAKSLSGSPASPRLLGTRFVLPDMARVARKWVRPTAARGEHVFCALRTLFSAQPMGP